MSPGTDRLTLEQAKALDTDGYLILGAMIPPEDLPALREIFEREAAKKPQGGTRHTDLSGEPRIRELALHSKVMAAARHILGDGFKAVVPHGRDPASGYGQQGLHADAPPRTGSYLIVTAIWMLDDFTTSNGPTRLVPGTHVLPGPVPKSYADPASHHPKEIFAIAPAGSVLVFNGHLWHSGSRNNSAGPRRALQGIYHRPEFFYQADHLGA